MSKQDEQRLMVKIATLYYTEGMKQSDIARTLHLSQSFISRMLVRCLNEGVVKISVIPPGNIFPAVEKSLEKRYGLKQAIVVDTAEDATQMQIRHAIGSAAAHYVETRIRANDLVGISSWSDTIRAMVDALHPQSVKARGVIQLLGGVGANGNVQATILTQTLAAAMNCKAWLLPSQSIERSVDERHRLSTSDDVAEVVSKFAEVDVAIVGIGELEPSQQLKSSGNYYDEEMLRILASRGAVGDICLHYYDASGKPVLNDGEDPVIGMELSQVHACPQVVALAGGLSKASAIRGALVGEYINVLIVDYPTARKLLEEY
ncbi:sugar-binding transcriptional regulator [Erwinia sp. E_sp_B04_7]|uniref:sugar-binding transcriptional regulator n=1 Tax=unclassified Erwinia TaxID=2622719 RepID=UPI0030D4BA91